MDFEKYDKIINQNKFEMTFLYIYYNLQLNFEEFKTLNEEQKKYLIIFIHDTYLKDEHYTDLGLICDVALENRNEILKNNKQFTKWDLLEKCYNKI